MTINLLLIILLTGILIIPCAGEIKFKNEKFDLLIIAPNKFSYNLKPLILHKENHGIKTILITCENIYRNHNGIDRAEKVKICIKNMLENFDIKYVLLVGGLKGYIKNPLNKYNWYVPARYSHLDLDGFPETEYLCDLYFADIYDENRNFVSWNDDSNGRDDWFGEWRWYQGSEIKDNRDLTPDIAIGRLPCRNKHEVKTMVNKNNSLFTHASATNFEGNLTSYVQ